MPLLVEEDYEYLSEIGQAHEEFEPQRSLIFRNFPLPEGVYAADGRPVQTVHVLVEIPANYNLSGPDMFWVNPTLLFANGTQIVAASQGGDPRNVGGETFERWSRHWGHIGWKPGQDTISTIVDRLNWAFRHPNPADADGPHFNTSKY